MGHSLPASSSKSFTVLPASSTKVHALLSASTDPVPKPGLMSWGFLLLHPLPDTNFCICYLLLYNKTLQNLVVSNNHIGFYLIIQWIGWWVLLLLFPGLQSTGRLASPGLFSPEGPPSWVHKRTSMVVMDNEQSKVKFPKFLEAIFRGYPMSLLPYSISQMKSPSQPIVKGWKKVLYILIEGTAKDMHTRKCDSLGASVDNNLHIIYIFMYRNM